MQKMKKLVAALFLVITGNSFAQISILNTNLNSLNITPQSLCQVNIMNGASTEVQVMLEAKLLNSANENVLTVKTNSFSLAVGMNNGLGLNYTIQSSTFGITGQAQYVNTTHTLPSGNFKYCVSVIALTDINGDDYCEDIVSDISSFLNLVYPYDKDTIETANPLLTWTHSEPFNILSTGDHFRMLVVELSADQSAEAGVIANNPVFLKDYVGSHQVLYPYDARQLEEGKRYGWQVQKLSNGTIIDKTEAWEFTLKKTIVAADNKYTTLKKKQDGSIYLASNEKIFFRYTESYTGGTLNYIILNDKMEEMKPEIKNDKIKEEESAMKNNGANYYEIDLSSLNLKKGFYDLEVFGSKNEKYVLKFKVE
jgi:hypothetical protein